MTGSDGQDDLIRVRINAENQVTLAIDGGAIGLDLDLTMLIYLSAHFDNPLGHDRLLSFIGYLCSSIRHTT
jgi:hypothetical protein